jgi:hypothetical protein
MFVLLNHFYLLFIEAIKSKTRGRLVPYRSGEMAPPPPPLHNSVYFYILLTAYAKIPARGRIVA